MAGRRIVDEREARRALAAAARKGLGPGSWARAHGIDGRSLHAWQMALERRAAKARRAELVELVAAPPAQNPTRYVLRRGDVTFEFGDDAREETLRRVVAVLRAC
jgi:hypothetical protein